MAVSGFLSFLMRLLLDFGKDEKGGILRGKQCKFLFFKAG
jgi:hypothetical protein